MRNHKGLLALIFLVSFSSIFWIGCERSEVKEDYGETTISIFMEKTIGGQARRIPLYKTTSDGPFVIELEGADMSLTMKEPPKDLEEDIKKDIKEND